MVIEPGLGFLCDNNNKKKIVKHEFYLQKYVKKYITPISETNWRIT